MIGAFVAWVFCRLGLLSSGVFVVWAFVDWGFCRLRLLSPGLLSLGFLSLGLLSCLQIKHFTLKVNMKIIGKITPRIIFKEPDDVQNDRF